jgi:hypothetical protein
MIDNLNSEKVLTSEESSVIEYPPFITVYQCNDFWIYIGETTADLSPLEENVYLIPAFAVETPPPPYDFEKQFCEWDGADWLVKEIPIPPPPPPPSRDEIIKEKTQQIKAKRDFHTQNGVFARDHWYPTTPTAQEQWTFLRGLARDVKTDGGDMDAVMTDLNGNPWKWQTLDGAIVKMTANLVIEITDQGATNQNQNFQNAKRHIALLEQSEDPENYDFSDGWTAIYEV